MKVFVLWDNNADSMRGGRFFKGLFANPESAEQFLCERYGRTVEELYEQRWLVKDGDYPTYNGYFGIEETEVKDYGVPRN